MPLKCSYFLFWRLHVKGSLVFPRSLDWQPGRSGPPLGLSMNQSMAECQRLPNISGTRKTNLWECLPKSDSNLWISNEVALSWLYMRFWGQASCCSWEDASLYSHHKEPVMCFAIKKKKCQASIWPTASITRKNDSFLDCGCATTQVFFLVDLGVYNLLWLKWKKNFFAAIHRTLEH